MSENKKPNTRKKTTNPQMFDIGRLPSQNIELEVAVIGAIMLEKQAMFLVKNILRPEMFYKESHQKIFSACIKLEEKSEPIDIMTVSTQLQKDGELELIGGPYYISQLTNKIASAANIESHSMLLLEHYIKREHVRIGSELITQGYDETIDIMETNEEIAKYANELLNIIEPNTQKSNVDLIREVMKQMEFAKKHDGINGVKSGFSKHDEITNGWQPSDLIYIAARPSMGKTAYVLTQARHIACEEKKDVAFFSLEMKGPKLMQRMISAEIQMKLEKIQKGNLDANEWTYFNGAIKRLETDKLHIFDNIKSIQGIKSKCIELHLKGKLDIIMIDYLQLIEHPSFQGNREGEVSKISRMLKLLAMELNVPIVCLSQLSRKVEERTSKRPQLSDLRDSGSIEQDADVVEFLMRPAYYKMNNSPEDLALILIQKHRNGSLATLELTFTGDYVEFSDREAKPFSPSNKVQNVEQDEDEDGTPF